MPAARGPPRGRIYRPPACPWPAPPAAPWPPCRPPPWRPPPCRPPPPPPPPRRPRVTRPLESTTPTPGMMLACLLVFVTLRSTKTATTTTTMITTTETAGLTCFRTRAHLLSRRSSHLAPTLLAPAAQSLRPCRALRAVTPCRERRAGHARIPPCGPGEAPQTQPLGPLSALITTTTTLHHPTPRFEGRCGWANKADPTPCPAGPRRVSHRGQRGLHRPDVVR
jgi:hypothetical protein